MTHSTALFEALSNTIGDSHYSVAEVHMTLIYLLAIASLQLLGDTEETESIIDFTTERFENAIDHLLYSNSLASQLIH